VKVDGKAEDMVPPAPRYAEIAAACRMMGMRIEDNDYAKIDLLLATTDEATLLGALPEPPQSTPQEDERPPPPPYVREMT
jgi:hypothetical protein